MLPLYDMLANAQNGQAMETLARQFNLTQQQTQAAIDALLPAFSQGLKRNASDPYGVAAFMNAMASGQHAKYFEDASKAFAPQGVEEGNGILGHLFGSKELSRAVASQAAQATGLGQQLLQQMLPVIASMIMGGLFKQSTNQLQQSGSGGNPLGEIIEQMMRQGAGGGGQSSPRQAPQPANPFDNPFGKVLQDMFGGVAAGQPQAGTQQNNPHADNPLGKIFEQMLGGRQGREAPPERRTTRRQAEPGARSKNPYDDLFGQMFETGARQRDEYQKSMESIFDQFTKGMDRHR